MPRGQIGGDFSGQYVTPTQVNPTSEFNISIPNPNDYKDLWAKNKAVSIPNLFPELQMEELWQYYYNQPNNWWNHVIHPDPYYDYSTSEEYHMYYTTENDPTFQEREAYAREVNNQGKFSYMYYRVDHNQGKQHPHLGIFSHPKFIALLEHITGHENLEYEPNLTFISNYQEGHYNGPHTDGSNGRIAFVFHMTKNWRPEYGGLFMRTDWDDITVNKTVTPSFNTLSMFDTSDGGAPHLVSEVVKGVNNKRISYTGWYK